MAPVARGAALPAGRTPAAADEVSAFWWDAVARGELLIERCETCGSVQHPPHGRCGACGSDAIGAVASAGRGRVHSWVACHYPRFPGYAYPYVVALVELDEGVRVCAEYRGPRARCEIGERVAVAFMATADERVLPVIVPHAGT